MKGVASAPPRVPFVVCVGVTGHRANALADIDEAFLRSRIRDLLLLIEQAARALFKRESDSFAGQPPQLRFISPIADGADQVAAEIALELGWELQAVLPFARDQYRTSLMSEQARQSFDSLLERSTCLLELPGDPDQSLDAYVMTGRATVAHCDLLIAIWDGKPPRGRGGTGEVVQLALTRGTAIAHVPLKSDEPVRLLWAAFDPTVLTVAEEASVERPSDRESMDLMLFGLLMPPADPQERDFIKRFARERPKALRVRIEYPLLLSAAGVRRIKSSDLNNNRCEQQIREDWRRYRHGCADAYQLSAPIDLLEEAYSWADRLATHFAQTYRSGHIFSFILGSVAVCLGLSAFMAPHLQFHFAAVEMVITVAIIANAVIGTRNQWHRRWLDYRQLAERLRPMRSLKLLGIAEPDRPGTRTNPVPRRWIEWYAQGIWRGMGCPGGRFDKSSADELATAIAEHEIAPQVAYHERNSEVIRLLDKRLGQIGMGLFLVTLAVSIATLVGLGYGSSWVEEYGDWFTLVQAGFPALGTAVFGIRFQADFGGDAIRSLATAETLRTIDQELRKPITLSRAADLTEQGARVMLSDLDEWRLVNEQRELEFG